MTKLVRALARTALAAAALLGVLTVIGIQRGTDCVNCAQQPQEFSGLKESSNEEFFQRASRYRFLQAAPDSGEVKPEENNTSADHEKYYDEEKADELTLRFQHRKHEIQRICTDEISSTAKSSPLNHWEFLINHRFKLTWCSIFKSASSSWFDYFMLLAGVDPTARKNSDVELARKTAYPRPSLDDLLFFLNDPLYTSFVIVREPFERILSSYQDKIVNSKLKFYQEARCRMVKEKKTAKNCHPSFPQYVDFIIQEHSSGKRMDEHWQPYTLFCSLCQANYTYVLKFENLQEEQDYLVDHVPGLDKFPLLHEHSSARDYSALVFQHYSQLSRAQLDGLVSVYRDDFLISGHSWLKYYDFIQGEIS